MLCSIRHEGEWPRDTVLPQCTELGIEWCVPYYSVCLAVCYQSTGFFSNFYYDNNIINYMIVYCFDCSVLV